MELTKLILSKNPDRLVAAYENGITKIVLPEFDALMTTSQQNPNHQYSAGEHTLYVMQYAGDKERQRTYIQKVLPEFPVNEVLSAREWNAKELQILKYAALLHDVAKPECKVLLENGEENFPEHALLGAEKAKKIMQRLKFDNETTDYVKRLVAAHSEYLRYGESEEANLALMRKMMHRLGADVMELLWELQLSDILAQHPDSLKGKLDCLAESKRLYKAVIDRGDCVSLKQLAVNGRDLMEEAGVPSGVLVGEILGQLLAAVLENPAMNCRETLLKYAETLRK